MSYQCEAQLHYECEAHSQLHYGGEAHSYAVGGQSNM